jgi:AcrR family transcriptional regulator
MKGLNKLTKRMDDLRVIRTKKLIKDTLLTIIEEEGFESVTIGDLARRAGINRGTFYLHYRDIYDLMEKFETEMIQGLLDYANDTDPKNLLNHDSEHEPFAEMMYIFTYLSQHARFFKVIFDPRGLPMFGTRLKSLIRTHMFAKAPKRMIELEALSVPPDFFIAYMSAAYFGIIQYWFETGMALLPQEIALLLTRLIQYSPLQIALNKENP